MKEWVSQIKARTEHYLIFHHRTTRSCTKCVDCEYFGANWSCHDTYTLKISTPLRLTWRPHFWQMLRACAFPCPVPSVSLPNKLSKRLWRWLEYVCTSCCSPLDSTVCSSTSMRVFKRPRSSESCRYGEHCSDVTSTIYMCEVHGIGGIETI